MDLTGYLDDLNEKAAFVFKREEGDYEKDGLLYCGKCHTPKQGVQDFFGIVSIPCQCRTAIMEAEQAKRDAERRAEHIKRLRREAFPDPRMATWTFEKDDGANPVSLAMKKYAEDFDTVKWEPINGFVLYGPTGTGKTFLAACVANRLIDRCVPVLMTSIDRIRSELDQHRGERQEYIDDLAQVPFLVLDDLAAESHDSRTQELVFAVINARAQSGRPMIITSNITAAELKNPTNAASKRVFSRILGMCLPVEIKGDDRRINTLRSGAKTLMDIVGL